MEETDGTPRPAHASPSRMSESTRGAVVTTPPYEEFYRANFDHLVATLALTLGNLDLAKDAAAEAMTRAYQRWNEVATYANPQGWTYRVGLNWARSWFRKRRRELSGVYVDNGTEDPPVADPALQRALTHLSIDHRSVVVLRYFADWSIEQIAETLDIPQGTVKSRLHRAVEQLNNELKEPA